MAKQLLKERFQQYAEVKAKFDKTKKSDGAQIGELNRSLRELGEFPSWFSKNTPEIRYLKLVKSFVTDMGTALATRNDQLLEIARKDYDKYSKDLQKMLEITGNVAATTGLDFRTAAEQIQRSFAGGIAAADVFRERGVRALLGFKAIAFLIY